MTGALPKEESSEISEPLKCVAGGLAFWMRVIAIMGLLGVLIQWGKVLSQAAVVPASESFAPFVSGLISCIMSLFFWQCAGSFRRIAKGEQTGNRSLEHALRQLKLFFCMLTILTVVGVAAAVWLLSTGRLGRGLSDAARQQIVDAVQRANTESLRQGDSRLEQAEPRPDNPKHPLSNTEATP